MAQLLLLTEYLDRGDDELGREEHADTPLQARLPRKDLLQRVDEGVRERGGDEGAVCDHLERLAGHLGAREEVHEER